MIPVKYISSYLPAAMAAVFFCCLLSCSGGKEKDVTVDRLLDEMLSVEEGARYPAIPYQALSVSGRMEEALFDRQGPGVITRLLTAQGKMQGLLHFYFDGSEDAEMSLPVSGLSLPDILEEGGGLLCYHTNPRSGAAEGSTLFLPVPYEKSCRITFEHTGGAAASGHFRIDYRQYPEHTSVETFSLKKLSHLKKKIADVDHLLQNPPRPERLEKSAIRGEAMLEEGAPIVVRLPQGEHAVYEWEVQVTPMGDEYAQSMRNLVLQGTFDGKQTLRAPLADFSGGGMSAPAVESRYLSSDGKGSVVSRWLMPYMEKASLAFVNEGRKPVHIRYAIYAAPLPWDERMLYFHASWKEETGIPLSASEKNEWNFASISGGRGVYKGDVFSVYNHTSGWYGKGSDRIRIDGEETRQTETNLGYYYNHPQQPVRTFQTPFGGAPQAGTKSMHGYNTFFRLRLLDGAPFVHRFDLDMEWWGEKTGTVDCAATIFWYGDRKARPETTSRSEVTARTLPLPPSSESGEPEH
ncbi:MAG: DUF2961 domain-containing protein [Tannerellaceae bacterium]|jgi:hypothetical protein|nr:DUF2961 domain-containing protein [Tannerellaceae bacterium]